MRICAWSPGWGWGRAGVGPLQVHPVPETPSAQWYLPLRIPLVPPPHRRILHSGPEGTEGSRQCIRRGDF